MTKWFGKFSDIPGVAYEPSIRVGRLRNQSVKPKLHIDVFDGKRHESLEWPGVSGITTSASPAHQWATEHLQEGDSAMLGRRLAETLELPGEASDYHFAIQGVIDLLWKRRQEEPTLVGEVERLCKLDINLVEACPEAISFDQDGKLQYYRIVAFHRLVDLYEREGFLREALEVAARGLRLGQSEKDHERLVERITTLESEDA